MDTDLTALIRPPMEHTLLKMANLLAQDRSTCKRARVGALVTDFGMNTILSIGYNGPERGGPNRCRGSHEPGSCQCIHAECNVLIKAPYDRGPLKLFTTYSPCPVCARLICQSQIIEVHYGIEYRLTEGLDLLNERGVVTFFHRNVL